MNQRDTLPVRMGARPGGHHAGIVQQELGGEIVAAIHHHIVVLDYAGDIIRLEPFGKDIQFDVRIELF